MKLTYTLRIIGLCLCLNCISHAPAIAQTSAAYTTKYTVKAGDTFVGIARKHHVTPTALQKLNPGVQPEQIKTDQPLNVPQQTATIVKSARKTPTATQQEPKVSYTEYKVKRKDTLYSLAKKHNVTIEQIIDANPQLKENNGKLKKGMTIRIPIITEKTVAQPKPQGLKTVKVAVLLPFAGNGVENQRSVEFYRGMLIGIEKLKNSNTNVHVTAYNEPAPEASVTSMVSEIMRNAPDVIVGPLYPGHFADVTAASSFNTKVAVPFSSKVPQVHSKPNVYVINTPVEYETKLSAEMFVKTFDKLHNVIILHALKGDKRTFCDALQGKLKAAGYNVSTAAASSSVDTFKALMQGRTEGKFVFVPDDTSTESLKALLPKLATLRKAYPKAQISLLGYEKWIALTDGDMKNELHAADTYLLTPNYFYPYTTAGMEFGQTYKQWFKTGLLDSCPRMAPLGYDFSISFLGGLATYGHKFSTQEPLPGTVAATPNLQTNLRFFNVENGGGCVNRSMWMIHFKKDLSIVKNPLN